MCEVKGHVEFKFSILPDPFVSVLPIVSPGVLYASFVLIIIRITVIVAFHVPSAYQKFYKCYCLILSICQVYL